MRRRWRSCAPQGVRTVVIHADQAPGSAWAAWATRPIAGLGLRRERRGPLVIYHLDG